MGRLRISDLTVQIHDELATAFESFGPPADWLAVIDFNHPTERYKAFEVVGAKSDLLGIIGSYGRTLDEGRGIDRATQDSLLK